MKESIPKIIHYCWFGKNKKPADVLGYIETWKNKCQGYEIIEWNEENFDLNINAYMKEAYIAKKWAFVTDYARLFLLYNYGGIYMDTDVEVLKSIDQFLQYPAFSGYEGKNNIPTGIMGSLKHNAWIKILLDNYDNRHFCLENGQYDLTTNVKSITKITQQNYDIKLDNTIQIFSDFAIFPFDYFCAKDLSDSVIKITDNTYTVHHFSGSWLPYKQRLKKQIISILGFKIVEKIVFIKHYFKL